tara:strand:- start:278 stop:421 length:144 start_codon:yes stop_codon:yes gene_type:complete
MEELRRLLGLLLMIQQDLDNTVKCTKFTRDTLNEAIGIVETKIKEEE